MPVEPSCDLAVVLRRQKQSFLSHSSEVANRFEGLSVNPGPPNRLRVLDSEVSLPQCVGGETLSGSIDRNLDAVLAWLDVHGSHQAVEAIGFS